MVHMVGRTYQPFFFQNDGLSGRTPSLFIKSTPITTVSTITTTGTAGEKRKFPVKYTNEDSSPPFCD
jgi:hypothetical protein